MSQEIQIDQNRLFAELTKLASFTHVEPSPDGTAVTRVVFTPDDLEARAWLRSIAEDAGFTVRVDPVGNAFFRMEGTDPSLPAVATGSHVDAIPHAGMYDGTVGVIGGLEAMRALTKAGIQPKRAIETILFTSEEPTRFGIGCLGSRLMSGTLSPEKADALKDSDERTLAEVRTAAGFTGDLADVQLAAGHFAAFVELHIEQGPLLERFGEQIGIVTSIAAPASYRFQIQGFGGHAGALLMPDRRDALCAAAELILAIEHHALKIGTIDSVATVGTCDVHPGAVNSVPSKVSLMLDIRDTDPVRRDAIMAAVRADIAEIQQRRGVAISESLVNADAPATSSTAIVDALEAICQREGMVYRKMVSRAYHDTLFMASVAPVSMIFIPCRGGVSHRPDEFSTAEDIARGTLLLAEVLAKVGSD